MLLYLIHSQKIVIVGGEYKGLSQINPSREEALVNEKRDFALGRAEWQQYSVNVSTVDEPDLHATRTLSPDKVGG